ncbi:MAG: hypothetical protein U9O82_01110 [Thermodesulfobacteriota bacterium]|nr:hypothetical protein [Thermodesulfobacteriota bacterium]
MDKGFKPNDTDQEAGEEQLFELIKQAGNEARIRKQEAMARHFDRLRAAIAEGILRKQDSALT